MRIIQYQHAKGSMKKLSERAGITLSIGLFAILSLAHGQSPAKANEPGSDPIEYSIVQSISANDSSAVIAEKAAKVLPRPNQTAWMRWSGHSLSTLARIPSEGGMGTGREDPSVFNPSELDADNGSAPSKSLAARWWFWFASITMDSTCGPPLL